MALKSILAALALAVLPAVAEATPIYAPVPSSEYVTIDGVDWAWASPCSATAPSCSSIDWSFQSGEGWRLPTPQEVATLIFGDLSGFLSHFDGGNICASAWFDNTYSHCDYGDAAFGGIWNGDGSPWYSETFVLRGAVAAIPVPAGGLLLLSALGGIAAFGRRRKAA
jgi:hypothetical protein